MGTIKVGQRAPKAYSSEGESQSVSWTGGKSVTLADEEKNALIESIMQLPKEKRVQAMRSSGLHAEADEYESYLATEHIREMNGGVEPAGESLSEAKAEPEGESDESSGRKRSRKSKRGRA